MTDTIKHPTWIDITTTISDGMVHWPDNAPVHITHTSSMAAGDAANVTKLSMSAHTSTHVDAPLHFIANGADMTALDLNTVIGPARVVKIEDEQAITLREIQDLPVAAGDRILFRTHNSDSDWGTEPFKEQAIKLDADAAEFLREKGVICVGVDYLTVGGPDAHHALLGHNITVIEGLALQTVAPGEYDLICLPLKIKGADGAPARVIIKPRDGSAA